MATTTTPKLGERFQQALTYTANLHRDQIRKGTDTPYVSHLLAVASLVLEHGGTEDQAIAALLHDALEDQSHRTSVAELRHLFGGDVAQLVVDCSDSVSAGKPSWRERKERYLAHLETASEAALLVSCADKLHNARSITTDLRTHGPSLWDRFTADRAGQLWYYTALADRFDRRLGNALSAELRRTVDDLAELAEAG